MQPSIHRRLFLAGLLLLTPSYIVGCAKSPPEDRPDKHELPDVAGLLSLAPYELVSWLRDNDYSYDESSEFFSTQGSFGDHSGTIVLTILGEDKESGRRISPEQLGNGVQPQAITATLFFTSANVLLLGETARHAILQEMGQNGIAQDDLIGLVVDEGVENNNAPSFAGAACEVNNREALWACTIVSQRGITVSCAYLRYYALSMHVAPDYDVIATVWGPWDISIDRHSIY